MFTLIVIIIILVSIFLALVVLAQSSKGDGLSGGLGAPGGVGAVFGVRRASDFLVKATITLGGAFLLLSLIANLFFLPTHSENRSAIQSGQAVTPSAMPRVPSSAPAVQQPPVQQQAPPQPAAPSGK